MTARDSRAAPGRAETAQQAQGEARASGDAAGGNRPTSGGMTGDTNAGFAAAIEAAARVAEAEAELSAAQVRMASRESDAVRQERAMRNAANRIARDIRKLTPPTDAAPVETETAKSDAMREALEWQPIATAPKDGAKLLLCDGPDDEVYIGYWETDIYAPNGGSGGPSGWFASNWMDRYGDSPVTEFPVYWHPIPKPPTARAALSGDPS